MSAREPIVRAIATSLVDRIAEKCPTLRVEHFPDAPGRFPFATAPESALVFYKGSTYAGESFGPRHHDRTIEWWVYVATRSLVDGSGAAYELVDAIESALVDDEWKPPQGGTAVTLVRNEFVEEDNGLWIYRVVVRHTLPRVARRTAPTGAAPVTPTIEVAP